MREAEQVRSRDPDRPDAHRHDAHGRDAHRPDRKARTLTVLAFLFGAVAVVEAFLIFGPLGAVCGELAYRRGDRFGRVGSFVAAGGMVVGYVLAVATYPGPDPPS